MLRAWLSFKTLKQKMSILGFIIKRLTKPKKLKCWLKQSQKVGYKVYQSKRYWDSIKLIKVDNLEPLEIVPLEDQHKQAEELEPETKLLLWKLKYQLN